METFSVNEMTSDRKRKFMLKPSKKIAKMLTLIFIEYKSQNLIGHEAIGSCNN